jgi:8-oxo-dGTP diphosphatase
LEAVAPKWLIVVAGFAVRGGRILLTQRMAGKHLAGAWEFPGGKLEAGESPQEALVREIREELGVDCKVGMLLDAVSYPYEKFDLLMLLYHIEIEGEPQPLEVGAIGWYLPGEISSLALPPADVPLVANLAAYLQRLNPPPAGGTR